ncbi:hypothetical protein C2H86_28610 [Pseudomonas putida]|uniref:Uncharacterized protein n=1 Tax=Pseudomonas putida TaxID=303 RepID=A0A6I7ERM6_PSEPU|nr:hypothetical protein C2H86_28610 [Pseudomonas putida]
MARYAGPVLDHQWFIAQGFPAVVAAQAQGVAVGHHQAFGLTEAAHGVAVTVDHRGQLAGFIVAVLGQRFDGLVVDYALDVGQAAQRLVVVQMYADTTGDTERSEVQEEADLTLTVFSPVTNNH